MHINTIGSMDVSPDVCGWRVVDVAMEGVGLGWVLQMGQWGEEQPQQLAGEIGQEAASGKSIFYVAMPAATEAMEHSASAL